MVDDALQPETDLRLSNPDSDDHIMAPPACGALIIAGGKQYNIPINGGGMSNPIFGDVHVAPQASSSEEIALKRGYRTIPFGDLELNPIDGDHAHISRSSCVYTARIDRRYVTVCLHRGGEDAKRAWEDEIRNACFGFANPTIMQIFAIAAVPNIYAVVYHGEYYEFGDCVEHATPHLRGEVLFAWWQQHGQLNFFKMFNISMYGPEEVQTYLNPMKKCFRFQYVKRHSAHPTRMTGNCFGSPTHYFHTYTELWKPIEEGSHPPGLQLIYAACVSYSGYRSTIQQMPWQQRTWGLIPIAAGVAVSKFRVTPQPLGVVPDVAGFRTTWIAGNRDHMTSTDHMESWGMLVKNNSRPIRVPLIERECLAVRIERERDTSLWTCQAENFLRRVRAKSSQNYGSISCTCIEISVQLGGARPNAFLFIAPPNTLFLPDTVIPDLAYWSLDPDGNIRLDRKAAAALGLPDIVIKASYQYIIYPAELYETIRAVHESRGFDPYSTQIAEHLGYPIFQLPTKPRTAQVHFFDENWEDGNTSVADLFPSIEKGGWAIRSR
ncbi:hypothetical protein MKEN_00161900 [Mycena kentingensis (nom. inval.)]|nr:hypothetical protein MKEN_00161900 [Mycena kentingensis (nom. inval.)]